MKDCTARSVYRVFFLKTNRRRGGVLENIACENVTAEKAIASVFEIDTDVLYEWAKFPDYENRTTRISNIRAENICVQSVRDLVKLRGAAELPPEKIRWRNLSAGKITGKKLIIENIKDAVEEP